MNTANTSYDYIGRPSAIFYNVMNKNLRIYIYFPLAVTGLLSQTSNTID